MASWNGTGIDPFLPERLASELQIVAAERRIYNEWLGAVGDWLVKVKRGVLAGPSPDPAAVWAHVEDWTTHMGRFVDGPVKDTMGIAYAEMLGDGYQFDTRPAAVAHLAEVANRMVRTPDLVYDLVAGQVAHGATAGQSIADIAARVEEILSVTGTERWAGRAVTVARTDTLGAHNAGRVSNW